MLLASFIPLYSVHFIKLLIKFNKDNKPEDESM